MFLGMFLAHIYSKNSDTILPKNQQPSESLQVSVETMFAGHILTTHAPLLGVQSITTHTCTQQVTVLACIHAFTQANGPKFKGSSH